MERAIETASEDKRARRGEQSREFELQSKFCGWGGRPKGEPQNLTISAEIALFVCNEDTRKSTAKF